MHSHDKERKRKHMKEKKENQTKKGKLVAIILVLLLLIGACSWMLVNQNKLSMDPDQSEGSLDGLSAAELQELMNKKVNEGSLMISINSKPEFPNGKSKGTLRIENSAQNRYLMIVKIYLRNDNGTDGELIYESGAIKPGNKIEEAPLKKELAKGTYHVIAYFEGYDVKTQEFVGKAASYLDILIKE